MAVDQTIHVIPITGWNITQGKPAQGNHCPVAIAIMQSPLAYRGKDKPPMTVHVSPKEIHIGGLWRYVPANRGQAKALREFTTRFDTNQPVKPFNLAIRKAILARRPPR